MFVDEDGFSIYLYSQGIGVEFQESARKGRTVQELDQDLLPHEAFLRVLGLRWLFPLCGFPLFRYSLPHPALGHQLSNFKGTCALNRINGERAIRNKFCSKFYISQNL